MNMTDRREKEDSIAGARKGPWAGLRRSKKFSEEAECLALKSAKDFGEWRTFK